MLPGLSRNTVTNVGREPSSGTTKFETLQERCQNLAEENRQLKITRNEQNQMIKDLNAQFARLKRDLRLGADGESETNPEAIIQDEKVIKQLHSKLAHVTKQRDDALHEIAELKEKLKRYKTYERTGGQASIHDHHGSGPSLNVADLFADPRGAKGVLRPRSAQQLPYSPVTLAEIIGGGEIGKEASEERRRVRDLIAERDELRAQLQQGKMAPGPRTADSSGRFEALQRANAAMEAEIHTLRERHASTTSTLEALAVERDRLAIELAIAKASSPVRSAATTATTQLRYESVQDAPAQQPLSSQYRPHASPAQQRNVGVAAASDPKVHQSITQQQAQLTVLASRFEETQARADTLQVECQRLVDELRAMHNAVADEKRRTFQLEHEKATLVVQAGRTSELEQSLNIKSEELIRCEQELLRMVDRLQSCSRETESQVRLELNSRLVDMEQLREEADRQRRAKERENFTLQTELSELRRQLSSAKEDVTYLKAQLEAISTDRADLASKYASHIASGPIDPKAAEETVTRLLDPQYAQHRDTDTLRDVGGHGGDTWELAQLREMTAAQALDLELATTRATAFEQQLTAKTAALSSAVSQCTELIDENLRLREQLTHVQTAMRRRDRAVLDEQAGRPAELALQVEHISVVDAAVRLAGVDDTVDPAHPVPSLLFVSVEGIADFEPAISDAVEVAGAADVSMAFRYPGIVVSSATATSLARDSVLIQLHRSLGVCSRIIATGDIILGSLLQNCLEGVAVHVPLFDADANRVADLTLRVTVSHIGLVVGALEAADVGVLPFAAGTNEMLPVSKPLPTATVGSGDTASLTAWLFSFRSVCKLRVLVTRCTGLSSSSPGVPPTPYVFYTATGPAASFIRDTVVHARGGEVMSCDPVFDAEPVDHPVVVSTVLHDALRDSAVSFVVFDRCSTDPEANLGTVTVPLAALLVAPTSTIVEVKQLHPSGSIEVLLSWVRW